MILGYKPEPIQPEVVCRDSNYETDR